MILPSGNSTTDYSKLANSRGWGAGWQACDAINAGMIRPVTATRSGASIAGGVHANIAELCTLIVNEIERRGYLLHPGWNWGAECRAISGSNTPSNHSWGLAMDLNAPNNPYTSSGVHDIPDWAYALFRSYGFGLGADYSGKKDWMHIEAMGTPSDMAIMTGLARQNLGGGVVVPPTPAKEWDELVTEAQFDAKLSAALAPLVKAVTEIQSRVRGTDTAPGQRHEQRDMLQSIDATASDLWGWTRGKDPVVDSLTRLKMDVGDVKAGVEDLVGNPPPVPTPPDVSTTYTVVSGDTLSGIAAKTGKSQADLQTWNNITDPNTINVGQVLRLGP